MSTTDNPNRALEQALQAWRLAGLGEIKRSENVLTTEHTEIHGDTRNIFRETPCNSVNSVVNKCDNQQPAINFQNVNRTPSSQETNLASRFSPLASQPNPQPVINFQNVNEPPRNRDVNLATRNSQLATQRTPPLATQPITPHSSLLTPNYSMVVDKLIESSDPVEALAMLEQRVAQCTLCKGLPQTRTQTVFGCGDPHARLLFLGEAPGADEDAQGIPFVGRSGRLLTDMIEKGMKLSRDEVYICNILRCRPPQNRNPLPEEAALCRPFMEAQIKIVNPEFICCLGAVAAKNLLQTDVSIGRLRGTIHDWNGHKVVCTYHPSYLLRNPSAKKDAWADLQLLMRAMGLM